MLEINELVRLYYDALTDNFQLETLNKFRYKGNNNILPKHQFTKEKCSTRWDSNPRLSQLNTFNRSINQNTRTTLPILSTYDMCTLSN